MRAQNRQAKTRNDVFVVKHYWRGLQTCSPTAFHEQKDAAGDISFEMLHVWQVSQWNRSVTFSGLEYLYWPSRVDNFSGLTSTRITEVQ